MSPAAVLEDEAPDRVLTVASGSLPSLQADGADSDSFFMYASIRFDAKPSGNAEVIFESGSSNEGFALTYAGGDEVVLRKCSPRFAEQTVRHKLYDAQRGPDSPYLDVYAGLRQRPGGVSMSLIVDGIELIAEYANTQITNDLSDADPAGFMEKAGAVCGGSTEEDPLTSAEVDLATGLHLFYASGIPTLAQLSSEGGASVGEWSETCADLKMAGNRRGRGTNASRPQAHMFALVVHRSAAVLWQRRADSPGRQSPMPLSKGPRREVVRATG